MNISAIQGEHCRALDSSRTDRDWDAVIQTSIITLDLSFQIVKAVVNEYEKLVRGEPSEYEIINGLATMVHN